MKKWIEKLFDLHIKTETFPVGIPDKENINSEWRLYEFLLENLTDDNKKILTEYNNLTSMRHGKELEAVYKQGFKTAVCLLLEALKE